jgi:hypothetical protein
MICLLLWCQLLPRTPSTDNCTAVGCANCKALYIGGIVCMWIITSLLAWLRVADCLSVSTSILVETHQTDSHQFLSTSCSRTSVTYALGITRLQHHALVPNSLPLVM